MSEKSGFLKSQLWSIILIVLVLIMGVEILFLVQENKKLREALSHSRGPVKILSPEEEVPSLAGVNLKGEEFKLTYPSSKKTVLFWFSPVCPSCEENLEFWKEIYQNHSSENLRFVGVTSFGKDKTEEFVKKFQLTFPVIIVSDLSLLDKYKVEVVPQTMLIDTSGTVQKVWPGPLSENYKKEIESMIS
ncbi:MAG: TlpA disulfide reductase family protein [candidate division Zixibacteria bacterium]|nr:TlpA disulfide reductase family protein [candidate division Zixibacteria bacterium]